MKIFAFISRHAPTPEQIVMAEQQEIGLFWVGDADAFTITPAWVYDHTRDSSADGVIVVHPAAALRLCSRFPIGVFENANRAEPGQPVSFFPVSLHVFDFVEDNS